METELRRENEPEYVKDGAMYFGGRYFVPAKPKLYCSVCGEHIKDGYPMIHSSSGAHKCIFCGYALSGGRDTPLRRKLCVLDRYRRAVWFPILSGWLRLVDKITGREVL